MRGSLVREPASRTRRRFVREPDAEVFDLGEELTRIMTPSETPEPALSSTPQEPGAEPNPTPDPQPVSHDEPPPRRTARVLRPHFKWTPAQDKGQERKDAAGEAQVTEVLPGTLPCRD